jgi:hypothetical protein
MFLLYQNGSNMSSVFVIKLVNLLNFFAHRLSRMKNELLTPHCVRCLVSLYANQTG